MHARSVVVLLAFALVAVSCGHGEQARGHTLVAAISGSPDLVDPHRTTAYASFQILENVYDTLVEPDEHLEMRPSLAQTWTTSPDALIWTFTLRQDVRFHNGRPLVADDVVFSIERIQGGANAFRVETVEEVVALDERTVEFRLSQRTPGLLENLGANKGMAIMPRELVEQGNPALDAIGTGPFELTEYQESQGATLTANRGYWREGPFVDAIEFRFISEPTAALTALSTGEIDWTDNIPPQQVEALAGDQRVVLQRVTSTDYWYFAANIAREPFDDPRVRRALAFGIDREIVTEAAKFGAAVPNQTAIPSNHPFAMEYDPYTHDPRRAQALLTEAGASDLSFEIMVTDAYPETLTAAQVIQAQLAEAGVDVRIRTLDLAGWLAEQGVGNFDVFMLGWIGNITPFDFYYANHRTGANRNFHGYSNPEVDRLLDQARTEPDEAARKALYHQAARLIVDEASYVYLYNPDVVHAWSPAVQGYEPRPDRAIRFRQVHLDR